jgi:hypothetical protein
MRRIAADPRYLRHSEGRRSLRASARNPVGGRPRRPPTGGPSPSRGPVILRNGDNAGVDLARLSWIATVFACVIAVVVLLLQGYYGYAIVTLAVAVSAGINLI